MRPTWSTWNLNQKLAAIAFLLGAVAVFGTPRQGPVTRVDSRELSRIVETGANQVAASELAAWILEGRADYRLLDLRDPDAFATYHIPTAERVGVTELGAYDLARNETVVIYGADETRGAKAWFILHAQGFRSASVLSGGLAAWKREVLFPVAPGPDADAGTQAEFDRMVRVSTFFGGQPRAAAAGGEPAAALAIPDVSMPQVVAPTGGDAGASKAAPRRKKAREGC